MIKWNRYMCALQKEKHPQAQQKCGQQALETHSRQF
jgi:hypothetical protein